MKEHKGLWQSGQTRPIAATLLMNFRPPCGGIQRPMLVQACELLWKARKRGTIRAEEHRNQWRSTTIALQKRKSCLIIG